MKYLMQKRENKAIGLIIKNFVSKETEFFIKELYKQQQQKDDENKKNGIFSLIIHCSSSIDSDTQASIAKKFSRKYRTSVAPTEEFCGSGSHACASRSGFGALSYGKNIDGRNFVKFGAGNPEIGINASLKPYPPMQRMHNWSMKDTI